MQQSACSACCWVGLQAQQLAALLTQPLQPLQLSSSWYSQHLSAVLHFVLLLCERIVQR
jgi:hypothetical protein